jgi:hypothetical protein
VVVVASDTCGHATHNLVHHLACRQHMKAGQRSRVQVLMFRPVLNLDATGASITQHDAQLASIFVPQCVIPPQSKALRSAPFKTTMHLCAMERTDRLHP